MTRQWAATRLASSPGLRRCVAAAVCLTMVAAIGGFLENAQAAPPTQTIFGSAMPSVKSDPDAQAVEVGVKFKVVTNGTITGVRYFKGNKNGGAHVGTVWTSGGTQLAAAVFRHESFSGWQSVSFATPVPVTAGQVYVVGYHTNVGHYADDIHYFQGKGAGAQQVQALADGVQGGDGLYSYSATPTFPTSSWEQTNYYVDVTFQPAAGSSSQSTTTTAKPTTTTAKPTTTTTQPPTTTTTRPATTTTTTGTSPSSTVPCALTVAANACWASHTGVHNGTGFTEAQILAGQSTLTHVVGDQTITTNGAVISNEWIDGCISIRANNVTIQNSLIHTQDSCQGGNNQAAGSAINDGGGDGTGAGVVTGLKIIDTDVDGMNVNFDYTGISAMNYTCIRCSSYGFIHNYWAGQNVLIQDSYSPYTSTNNNGLHVEAVDADSANNVTVEHSYLHTTSAQWVNSAFMNGGSWSPPQHITIDSSFLEGGVGADMQEGCGSTYITVTNNAFSSDNGYGGNDYIYGYNPSDTAMVWTGNYVAETNAAFPQPQSSC
jgi:hypothetical protein